MPEIWEGKKYKNTESENFDEYMKALGKWILIEFSWNSAQPFPYHIEWSYDT